MNDHKIHVSQKMTKLFPSIALKLNLLNLNIRMNIALNINDFFLQLIRVKYNNFNYF